MSIPVSENSPNFAIIETDYRQLALDTRSSTSDCMITVVRSDSMSSLDIKDFLRPSFSSLGTRRKYRLRWYRARTRF